MELIDMENDFFTFRGYMNRADSRITATMEDYIEMIYRLSQEKGYTRLSELSGALNVQPPAATRMVQKLGLMKLIKYQKYGMLELEDAGMSIGASLLARHNSIEKFLKLIGVKDSGLLEETEKTEHTVSKETQNCMSVFVEFIASNPDVGFAYDEFKKMRMP
jgi:Mn-dependent DtxR family transcriptional regulator